MTGISASALTADERPAIALTRSQRLDEGAAHRARLPRRRLGDLVVAPERDPLGILHQQNITRVPELVPIREERMAASAFAFYRGTAALMAADLATSPHTGIAVPSCGDAHVANFGFYASAQRTLMFDLNDFDETAWAPWEWDLKRLVTSIVVAGQATSRDELVIEEAALAATVAYARTLSVATSASPTDRYFAHFDAQTALERLDGTAHRALEAAIKDARKRTGARAAKRLTERGPDGRLRFIAVPPTMTEPSDEVIGRLQQAISDYEQTVSIDIWMLLQQYSVADLARRVVGVGSVGTRCYVAVFEDADGNALVLQTKQAQRSVLEEFGRVPQPANLTRVIAEKGEGARVVSLQRIMQAASDPFLGHLRSGDRDFYVRQFHDMKGGLDADTLEDAAFERYGVACATVLARAHAQSPHAATAAGYIGGGSRLAGAVLEWAQAYGERSRRDYEAFIAARASASAPS